MYRWLYTATRSDAGGQRKQSLCQAPSKTFANERSKRFPVYFHSKTSSGEVQKFKNVRIFHDLLCQWCTRFWISPSQHPAYVVALDIALKGSYSQLATQRVTNWECKLKLLDISQIALIKTGTKLKCQLLRQIFQCSFSICGSDISRLSIFDNELADLLYKVLWYICSYCWSGKPANGPATSRAGSGNKASPPESCRVKMYSDLNP